ncbi:PQ-loop domain-containing transporter [Mesomycoplasma molare]|uniref:PQ-loop domain-containing transporter n=1 Tax=Mesomycoplasma molare TaxID=171288 RepID=UPI000483574F|nr:PQ-loop domain-containing transporter [Mesomycoplasma molare]
METIKDIFGWMAVIFTISFAAPQLIKTIKEKSGKEVRLINFFIFLAGLALWGFYGAFFTIKVIQLIIANVLSFIILSITISLFLKNKNSKFLPQFIFLIIIANLTIIVASSLAFANNLIAPNWLLRSLGFIAPTFTSFAFAPLTFQAIKTRKIEGVSIITLVIGFLINFTWEVFWIIEAINSSLFTNADTLYILIVQLLAMIIYTIQIIIYIQEKNKKNTKKHH